MKKFISVLIAVVMLISAVPTVSVFAADNISVYIDGQQITFPTPPIIVNGTTLVPMRSMFEALGAVVTWNNEKKAAIGDAYGIHLVITIDSPTMERNSIEVPLQESARIVDGNTLIPLRAVSECFGMQVDFDASTNSIFLTDLNKIQKLAWNSNYTYYGEVTDGAPDGYGELYNNADGQLEVMGLFEGHSFVQGSQSFDDGTFESGFFKDFKLNGHGKRTFQDGSFYEGEWVDGALNGLGLEVLANGFSYVGDFVNGIREGNGRSFYAGIEYEGSFSAGEYNGIGILYYPDGVCQACYYDKDQLVASSKIYPSSLLSDETFKSSLLDIAQLKYDVICAKEAYLQSLTDSQQEIQECLDEYEDLIYNQPDPMSSEYLEWQIKVDATSNMLDSLMESQDIIAETNKQTYLRLQSILSSYEKNLERDYNLFVPTNSNTSTTSSNSSNNTQINITAQKGVCLFANCTNELRTSDVNYCSKHACEVSGCVYPICNTNSRYCLNHKCQIPDCYDGQKSGSYYCYSHNCIAYGCTNPRDGMNYYCSQHKLF